MTKTKKIIIGVIILAVAVCAVFVTLFEIGFFEKSNYKFLNYDKYVKVGKYKGLKYTAKKVSVTQKEIDQEITSRRTSAQTQKSVKSGTLAKGDVANISYVGKIDGKKFDGGSASDYDLTLGSNSMIKGFESGLIGHKVGDKVKLNLTFPKDYGTKKLRNKKAVFEVTINAKKVTVTPKYDTAFIKQNTGNKYSTKEDYEKYIKEYLTKQKEATALSEVKSDLWSQVVTASKSTGKYPKKQLAYEKEKFTNQYKNYAKNYNMSFKTFLKAQGMTEDIPEGPGHDGEDLQQEGERVCEDSGEAEVRDVLHCEEGRHQGDRQAVQGLSEEDAEECGLHRIFLPEPVRYDHREVR